MARLRANSERVRRVAARTRVDADRLLDELGDELARAEEQIRRSREALELARRTHPAWPALCGEPPRHR